MGLHLLIGSFQHKVCSDLQLRCQGRGMSLQEQPQRRFCPPRDRAEEAAWEDAAVLSTAKTLQGRGMPVVMGF